LRNTAHPSTARTSTVALNTLLKTRQHIKTLRLRSFEPDLYLVEVLLDQQFLTVTDDQAKNLVYRSQLAAKHPFKALSVDNAILLHASCYDEMIGQPVSLGNQLETRISLPCNDYS